MSETQKAILALLGAGGMFVAGMFTGGEVKEDKQPETPAVTANCPSGWEDKSDTPQDSIVYSCTKDGWIVILTPNKTFERAWREGLAEWTTDPEVAGWPK